MEKCGLCSCGSGYGQVVGCEKDSSGGASLCKGFHEGDLEGGLLYWGTRKMRFLRDMQNAL